MRICKYNYSYALFVWSIAFLLEGAEYGNTCSRNGIIVEGTNAVNLLNEILHEYSEFIIGRMGIPYKQKHISVISIALDAPQNTIAALAGKLGNIKGISVKTACSNVISHD